MAGFKRGFYDSALDKLSSLAKRPDSWWKHLLDLWTPSGASVGARPLRIAVRDGYLNFYLKGQSVSRVGFDRFHEPFAEVHIKYAFDDVASKEQSYAKLTGKNIVQSKNGRSIDYTGAGTLRDWMARAALWETPEKTAVERVIADNPSVIDLEMGLPADAMRKTALRMDIVVLESDGEGARIVFWEAKRLSDGRLRSNSPKPEVITQIEAYRSYLQASAHRQDVINAYQRTCETLVAFAKMAQHDCIKRLDPMIVKAARREISLDVDDEPRLVIFGDEAELSSPTWRPHQKKLEDLGVKIRMLRTDAYRLT